MLNVSNKNKISLTPLGYILFKTSLITFILIILSSANTFAGTSMPSNFTYQGRLMNSAGNAPLATNNTIYFEIRNPSGTCILYSEFQNVNTTATAGLFSVRIGSGTRTVGVGGYQDDPGYEFTEIFTNKKPFPSVAGSCPGGWTPGATDARILRLHVFDGSTTTTLADQTLSPVPQASVADTVDGVPLSGLTLNWTTATRPTHPVTGMHGYNDTLGRFEKWNGAAWVPTTPKFSTTAIDDTATNNHVLKWNDGTNVWEPSDVGTLLGNPGGDVSGTYGSMTVEAIQGQGVAATAPNSGEVLKWNGSEWEAAPDAGGVAMATGAGTTNRLTKWNASDELADSNVTDDGTNVTIAIPLLMNAQQIKNVAAPTDPNDAVTLNYLEQFVVPGTADGQILVWDNTALAWEPTAAPAGGTVISGGTQNRIPKFNATGDNIGDSSITDSGTLVTVANPLAVQGPLVLQEIAAPTATAGYSKIYPKADNNLYYMNEAGTESQFVFGSGAGEVNTGSSVGGTADVFKQKTGVDLEFRGITAGTGITVTENANDITVATTGLQTAITAGTNTSHYLKWDGDSWEPAFVSSLSAADGTPAAALTVDNDGIVSVSGSHTVTNNTDVATKLYVDTVTGALSPVTDGTTTGQTLRWDGDSWEPMTLADGTMMMGNATGAVAVTMSQDVTLTNAGVATVGGLKGEALPTLTADGQSYVWDQTATEWRATDVTGLADGYVMKWDAAARRWEAGPDAGAAGTVASIEGLTGTIDLQNAATGNAPNWSVAGSDITLNIPLASSAGTVTSGTISNADYVSFSGKQAAITDGTNTSQYLKWDGNSWEPAYVSSFTSPDGTPLVAVSVDNDGKLAFPTGVGINEFSSDGTLAGDSDDAVPTEKAVKTYVDAATGALSPVTDGTTTGQTLRWDGNSWEPMTLADGTMMMGNATGAVAVTMSGDATITNAGVLTIANDAVTTAKIDDGAVTLDKLSPGTQNGQIVFWDSTNTQWNVVDTTGIATGNILKWDATCNSNAGCWELATDAGAAGTVASIEGLAGTINLDNGSTGNAPNWAASGSDITLHIPLASSGAGVTSGTISNAQYVRIPAAGGTTNDTLRWDGDSWEPTDGLTIEADGDVVLANAPTADEHAATKLYVDTVTAAIVPPPVTDGTTTGQTLRWDGNSWEPMTLADGTMMMGNATGAVAVTMSQDVTLTNAGVATVGGLKGEALPTLTADGQSYVWDQTATEWRATDVTGIADGYVMKWDATNRVWEAAADAGGLTDVTGSDLLDGRIWIGDGSNDAQEIALSGDVTMTNAGVTTVAGLNGEALPALAADGQFYTWDQTAAEWRTTDMTGLADGYVMKWDAAARRWEAGPDAGATGVVTSVEGAAGAVDLLNGSTGNAPNWTQSGSNVTLHIPLASSGASVTSGTLSNAEYARIPASGTANDNTLRWSGTAWVESAGLKIEADGDVVLANAPTVDAHAATKLYVDNAVGAIAPVSDGTTTGQILRWDGDSWEPMTLATGTMLMGNATGAVAVTMSGDATITNAGAITIANDAVTTAKILNGTILFEDIAANGCTATQTLARNAGNNAWECVAAATTIHRTGGDGTDPTWYLINTTTPASIPADAAGNLAVGRNTLTAMNNATADWNTALGHYALEDLTSGSSNVGVGAGAGKNITSGTRNIAIGEDALMGNTTASNNIVLGYQNMYNNNNGGHNVSIGTQATGSLTGTNNVAMGSYAMSTASSADANVSIGANSLYDVTTGDNNTALGHYAGRYSATTSAGNVYIGYSAGPTSATTQNNKLYINNSASATPLIYGEFDNNFVRIHNILELPEIATPATPASGYGRIYFKTDGLYYRDDGGTENKVATGSAGLSGTGTQYTIPMYNNAGGTTLGNSLLTQSSTTANNEILLAGTRMLSNRGSSSTFVGNAGNNSNSGAANTAVGNEALDSLTSGVRNTAVGSGALSAITDGQNNIGVGSGSYEDGTGSDNISIGIEAMQTATTGSSNVAIGTAAMKAIDSGANNIGIGVYTMGAITTGNYNVAVGSGANTAESSLGGVTTGTYNTAIGFGAGRNATGASASNVFIGANVGPTTGGAISNRLYIHNAASDTPLIYGDFSAGSVTINGAGGLTVGAYYYSSDRRLKENISTIESPLEKILKLRAVSFDWKDGGKHDLGFIAQEVEEVFPELVGENEQGIKSVKYGNIVAPLVGAVQELDNMSKMSAQQIAAIDSRLATAERKIASLEEKTAQQQKEIELLKEQVQFLMKEIKK